MNCFFFVTSTLKTCFRCRGEGGRKIYSVAWCQCGHYCAKWIIYKWATKSSHCGEKKANIPVLPVTEKQSPKVLIRFSWQLQYWGLEIRPANLFYVHKVYGSPSVSLFNRHRTEKETVCLRVNNSSIAGSLLSDVPLIESLRQSV